MDVVDCPLLLRVRPDTCVSIHTHFLDTISAHNQGPALDGQKCFIFKSGFSRCLWRNQENIPTRNHCAASSAHSLFHLKLFKAELCCSLIGMPCFLSIPCGRM